MVQAPYENEWDSDDTAGSITGQIRPTVLFTPEKATQALPLVKRVVTDLANLQATIAQQKQQLSGAVGRGGLIGESPYRDEVLEMENSLKADQARWQACARELASLGIQLHRPFDGYVDFPARLRLRHICLCWHPDDDSVSHWHDVGQCAGDRKPIGLSMLPSLAT